ncbi:MAG: hypothetical protein M3068_09870 [Gemmatimonadota bacterium]|nr:hypothetical protein [Gemmatimonadota bacterium]
MLKYRLSLIAAISAALVSGACAKKDNTLSQDSALSRDLQMANKDSAVQPQLKDVPAANAPATTSTVSRPAPTRTATRPTAPATATSKVTPAPTTTASGNSVARSTTGSEGRTATIGAGTTIAMTSNQRICTNTAHPGDRFTATVTEAVTGSNGATIPAGATAAVQVTSVSRSDNATDPIKMGFVVQSISWGGKSYPVDASISDVSVQQVRSDNNKDAQKVIGGAVIGAIAGRILGHDTKSTIIGAATGAAAGTAVAMGTGDYEGCLANGGRIAIKLNSPATITM